MPQTVAQLMPVLKEVYEGKINNQLNNQTKAYSRLKSNKKGVTTDRIGGKYVEFAIHTGRNSGIGARNEMEALPTAGRQKTQIGKIGLKHQYAGIQVTGQVFAMATSDYQTFADAVEMETTRIKDDLALDRNRQFWGNGNGRISTVVSTTGQTIVVSDLQYVQDDMVFDVVSTAGVMRGAKLTLTAVNEGTKTLTFTGTAPTGVVAGDILVRTGSYGREWTGMGAIVNNTGTLYNIDPNVDRVWKSEVMDLAGADISEVAMKRMADRITKNGGKTTVIWTTTGIERAYWQLLAAQRRFVNTKEFGGGFSGLEFNAGSAGPIQLITDYDAPAGTMTYLNEDEINVYRDKEFSFMDRDGNMWHQVMDAAGRYDAYGADLYEYSELGTHRRNTHGRISNIKEDAS